MRFVFVSLMVFGLLVCCNPGPRPEDAVKFNDSIVFRQDTLYILLDEFVSLMDQEADAETVEGKYTQALNYINRALMYVESTEPFDEEDEMRKAGIEYFKQQQLIFQNEFSQIVELYKMDPAEITTDVEDQWDSLMTNIILLDSLATDKFLTTQKIFAKKYSMTLKDIE